MKKLGAIAVLMFLLAGILAVPVLAAKDGVGAAQKTGVLQPSILEPGKAYLAKLGDYLPKLGGLLLILVIGSLIAVGIANLTGWFLSAIQLEKGAKKAKIPEILKKGGIGLSLSELIIEIIFFAVVVVTLITALEFYGLATGAFVAQILSYIPNVVTAVFILILGILAAIFISGVIRLVGGNVKIAQSAALGNIAKYAVIVIAGLAALKELGLAVILTDKSKDIILGGLILASALAFGLGTKEKAGKFLDGVFHK